MTRLDRCATFERGGARGAPWAGGSNAFVSDALAANPKALTIDAGGLQFIDPSGLQALLHARDAATEAGVAFRVSDPSPALRRMFELFGVDDLLTGG